MHKLDFRHRGGVGGDYLHLRLRLAGDGQGLGLLQEGGCRVLHAVAGSGKRTKVRLKSGDDRKRIVRVRGDSLLSGESQESGRAKGLSGRKCIGLCTLDVLPSFRFQRSW